LLVCGADLLCISHRRHPVGFWVTRLCRNHPLVAGAVSVVLGAMISHFFLHMNN
jgi:hypothetical protein